VAQKFSFIAEAAGNKLTAEHCASKKMETPKFRSAHPVRVGRKEPFGAPILEAKKQLDRQSEDQKHRPRSSKP
jgi:hypothetical protein